MKTSLFAFIMVIRGMIKKILQLINVYKYYLSLKSEYKLFCYKSNFQYHYYLRKRQCAPLLKTKVKIPSRAANLPNIIIIEEHLKSLGYI